MATAVSDPQFKLADIPDENDRRSRIPGPLRRANKGERVGFNSQCTRVATVPDGGDFGIGRGELTTVPAAAVLPARAAGAAMLPITYENQCRACHPLRIDRENAGDRQLAGTRRATHGLQVVEFLRAVCTRGQYVQGHREEAFLIRSC